MAKKKKARTAKQKAATKKMQRAAARARREKGHTKSPRKRAKSAKAKSHPKKKAAKRKSGKRKGGKRKGGKGRRGGPHTRSVRTEIIKTGRHTTQIAIVPVPSRSSGGGRRKTKRKGKKGKGRSRARETGYVMENPLSGMELFVGAITGLIGFGAADVLDRVLATHALTDKGTKDANGNELYADPGGTSGTSYSGLFNATAVLAPMDWKRWLFGGVLVAAPFLLAAFVKAPMGRSSLQLFGFGALVRVGGKGFQDLMGKLFKTTGFGQRLYDGEMRASALKAADGSEASLPSSGLGAPPAIGCGACANCVTGVGICCGRTGLKPSSAQGGTTQPPAPPPPPPPQQVAPPAPQGVPAPVVPQGVPQTMPGPTRGITQVPPTPAPNPFAAGMAGVPNGRRGGRYNWGTDAAAE